MKKTSIAFTLAASLAISACAAEPQPPIVFVGDSSVTANADGGLRPVVGVHNLQVVRGNRLHPEHRDGLDHTYLHAPMLAYWRGTFYLDYLSAPIHEHDAPTVTSLTTSTDGIEWTTPVTLFPAYRLPDGSYTLNHQRSSFYVAPNGRLLATAFYGEAPNPNDGSGIGRAIREIFEDGSFGPIYFIRYNSQPDWDENKAKEYPFYPDSPDEGFKQACAELLADKLMTAQWWEEDRSEDGFYREKGKALSYYHLYDGSVVGIWKNRVTMTTDDEGESWKRTGFAENIANSTSKYWGQRTEDGKFALVFNPTSRLRYPLAIATSDDGHRFANLLAVHGELPPQRFPGYYKNLGPQYVRGILEGNGTPPDNDLWLTYSVNKEDIWVSRVPVPVTDAVEGDFRDDFETTALNELPQAWNVYRPLWAPVSVVESGDRQKQALELADEDPYDYASVTRVFPETRSALIRFKLRADRVDGRMEVDVMSSDGQRPVRLAFTDTGAIEAMHEGIWKPAGAYPPKQWVDVEIDVNPGSNTDRFQIRINGKETLRRIAYFSELPETVERVTFRTGAYRPRGSGGHELPGADVKSERQSYLIDDVSIEPR